MPFPDGSGTADGPTPFDTYSAGHVEGDGPGAAGPQIGAAPGQGGFDNGTGMWPAGLEPPSFNDGGLPAYLVNPEAFVASPEDQNPDAPQSLRPGGPTVPSGDVEGWLRAQVAQAGGAPDEIVAGPPVPAPVAPEVPVVPPVPSERPTGDGHSFILYGTGVPLSLSASAPETPGIDIWKVACKTGTLALSPGPGQVDLDVPLTLTDEAFDDMLEGFREKAVPYVTVPETHANGSLENTGYVKALEKLSKAELLADSRIAQEGKDHVKDDPDDTSYLLAGIGFTNAKAKQAALEGSIPDTSVGVKMGYRNKRSGKTFRHMLEHLALTPIPWVDGLIPFNPAVALSASSWDQKDSTDQTFRFDGVFTEVKDDVIAQTSTGLDLATRIEHSGADFDAAATRAGLLALKPGDTLSWNYDVNVERLAADSVPEGAFFLVRAPESEDPRDYDWERRPKLYTDIESAMQAVVTGVAVCQQRRENEKARMVQTEIAQPIAAGTYSAETEEGSLDLAVSFDPQAHPRDYKGQFKKTLAGLKPGESAKLPDGITVRRKTQGLEGFHIGTSGPGTGGGNLASADDVEEAASEALKRSTSAGAKGELPDDLGGKADEPPKKTYTPDAKSLGLKKTEAKGNKTSHFKGEIDGKEVSVYQYKHLTGPSGSARYTRAWAATIGTQSVTTTAYDKAAAMRALADHLNEHGTNVPRRRHYSATQDLPDAERDTLSLASASGSLEDVNDGAQGMPTETTPTVEEILAQQQADIERLNALVESQQAALSLSAQRDQTQGDVIHRNEVGKRIRALNGVYPTSVLLAAQQVMTGDKSAITGETGGFNLSVQAPSADEPGKIEARELQTPTDVVMFMLSAMPTLDGGGQAAAQLAAINAGVDEFNLAAHRTGSNADPEAEAKAAVDEWHRNAHPEMYGPDGKLLAA